ncbi:Pkinase_Tyr domain-containing protein [Cephalotus follicularis]|uniref:Pkinase_Tyr domain-containing protein n=1 Tax=Cephalotus follicularis TaxID=3775 RepID=A0A1Q3BUR9_CEPFO|nr:Pkinase_Tyr domain-containing protein [Cephalotus follicularis]
MDNSLQAVVAATVSFFVVTLLFAVIIMVCKAKKKPTQRRPQTRTISKPKSNFELISGESATFDPSLNQISMAELVIATNNFSTDLIIGDGSFGLVYKAKLNNQVTVAIKKLDPDAFQGFREFRAEMETLGKLRHKNVVKILGYCATGLDRVLIYEFMERGSLDQWLHDTSSDVEASKQQLVSRSPLPWDTRVKVCSGIVDGLAYLHGLDTPIIHRDIKASNVLLDIEFEAHIADFGLARRIDTSHSHVSTQVAGTMGYMPPEYREGNTAATVMADVYSFGILMIEIASQKRPNWPVVLDGEEVGFIEWARKMVEQNRQIEMIHSNISREELIADNVKQYFKIALLCTNENSRSRPAMSEVSQLLKQISS